MNEKERFKKYGYVIIKNAFTIDEIKNLRKLCYKAFDQLKSKEVSSEINLKNNRQLTNEGFIKNPGLLNPLFKKNIIDKVKKVLGEDYITFADFSLNNNLHSPVWHTDSQLIGFSTKYVYSPSFNVAKLGLYLQEDDEIYGGQLDLIPGSHLPTFFGVNSPIPFKSRYGKVSKLQLMAILIRNKFLKKISVNVSLGDVILFHGLLWHRSSQPNWGKLKQIDRYGILDQPRNKRKFMIQWEVAENNEFAAFYATHKFKLYHEKSHDSTKYNLEDYPDSSKNIFESNKICIKTFSDLKIPIDGNIKSKDGTPIIFP